MSSSSAQTKFWQLAGALLFMIAAAIPGRATLPEDRSNDIDQTIAQITEARDLTSQYVVLSQRTFKVGSPEYNQAFKLYSAAYAKYDAWDAYVASALRRGKAKSLYNNKTYDSYASGATASSTAFIAFVDAHTGGESKAVTTILSALADLGIKLWTGISKQLDQQRSGAAKNFQDATKWKTWDELAVTGSPASPKADAPATATKPDAPHN